jgi:hypothetical protein
MTLFSEHRAAQRVFAGLEERGESEKPASPKWLSSIAVTEVYAAANFFAAEPPVEATL